MKKLISTEPYTGVNTVAIVATSDDDKINFAPHGMFGQMNFDPPLLYVSVIKEHRTADIISKTKRFSVNIASAELFEKVKYCGSVSGAEKDKSGEFDVFYGKNNVPMITKSPVNMNCEVYDSFEIKGMIVFIGQVIEAFAEEECLLDNLPVAQRVDPLLCTIPGRFYRIGTELK